MREFKFNILLLSVALLLGSCASRQVQSNSERKIWTKQQAADWYKKQGWLVGSNFMPSNAINQLEMFQAETFDAATIDKELGLAQSLGMNTMRIFLHDIVFDQDSTGFYRRIDTVLNLCRKHNIKPLLVFFDSCWDPFPKAGKQRSPKPHVHNSGWVQSPGYHSLQDSTQYPRLEKYVKSVVAKFAGDRRILGWDIWNEPDNDTGPAYRKVDLPDKVNYVIPLLKRSFAAARSSNPKQPLTSGIWVGDWTTHEGLKPIEKVQIEESDVISFHSYDKPDEFEKRIKLLQRYGRPILCTEYMARPQGSTFQGFLPIAKKYNVAMMNWGFVSGKSQTIYPWDSWTKTYTAEPAIWFHDIFKTDGTAYISEETDFIKDITSSK